MVSGDYDIGPTFDGPLSQAQLDARFHGHFMKGSLYTYIDVLLLVPNVKKGYPLRPIRGKRHTPLAQLNIVICIYL